MADADAEVWAKESAGERTRPFFCRCDFSLSDSVLPPRFFLFSLPAFSPSLPPQLHTLDGAKGPVEDTGGLENVYEHLLACTRCGEGKRGEEVLVQLLTKATAPGLITGSNHVEKLGEFVVDGEVEGAVSITVLQRRVCAVVEEVVGHVRLTTGNGKVQGRFSKVSAAIGLGVHVEEGARGAGIDICAVLNKQLDHVKVSLCDREVKRSFAVVGGFGQVEILRDAVIGADQGLAVGGDQILCDFKGVAKHSDMEDCGTEVVAKAQVVLELTSENCG